MRCDRFFSTLLSKLGRGSSFRFFSWGDTDYGISRLVIPPPLTSATFSAVADKIKATSCVLTKSCVLPFAMPERETNKRRRGKATENKKNKKLHIHIRLGKSGTFLFFSKKIFFIPRPNPRLPSSLVLSNLLALFTFSLPHPALALPSTWLGLSDENPELCS